MEYIKGIEQIYRSHTDREQAIPMEKYMKNKFAFFGIPSPDRKAINRAYIQKHGLPEVVQLPALIKTAYKNPHRELHYFIMGVTFKLQKKLPEDFIAIAKYMIINKSWWDTVDFIAAKIVGGLVKSYPDLVNVMDEWIEDENMWLQRTAILHQLKYKADTDQKRLFQYCKRCASSNEFFIRKAIGWSLREYSKTNAKAVIEFVEKTDLSNFSKKEALKWLERKKE